MIDSLLSPSRLPLSISWGILSGMNNKVLENRIRRVAARRGLLLTKCRARDDRALGYGMFMLIDPEHGGAINPDESAGRGWATLETIDRLLNKKPSTSARRR